MAYPSCCVDRRALCIRTLRHPETAVFRKQLSVMFIKIDV